MSERREPTGSRLLAERMTKHRLLRGYSTHQLAKMSGVSVRTIQQIEKEQRSCSAVVLFLIAKALGVPMEYLLGDTDDYVFFKTSVECVCGRAVTVVFEG